LSGSIYTRTRKIVIYTWIS